MTAFSERDFESVAGCRSLTMVPKRTVFAIGTLVLGPLGCDTVALGLRRQGPRALRDRNRARAQRVPRRSEGEVRMVTQGRQRHWTLAVVLSLLAFVLVGPALAAVNPRGNNGPIAGKIQ